MYICIINRKTKHRDIDSNVIEFYNFILFINYFILSLLCLSLIKAFPMKMNKEINGIENTNFNIK